MMTTVTKKKRRAKTDAFVLQALLDVIFLSLSPENELKSRFFKERDVSAIYDVITHFRATNITLQQPMHLLCYEFISHSQHMCASS
jgi:hypothetical protein